MIVKYTTGFLLVIFLLISGTITAQYGFGTNQPDQRSIVHIVSQDSTKGFIIPIVKNGAIAANPAIKGMLIYNLADNCIKMCDGAAWHCLMGDNSLGATDDQQLDSLRLNGKTLTAYLEDGGSASINIQPVIDSAYTDIASSLLNDNVWLNELRDSINTDQQNLSVGAGTAATSIIDINDGDSIVLREGSNIQLTESGSQITISATGDGTGTDDQNVDSLRLSGTTLTTYLEDGGNASVDLQPIVDSAVANVSSGSDDQNISGSGLSGTNLTIGIEGGSNQLVNLQPIVDSAVANAPSGSDDQNLSVEAGTASTSIVNIENGDSVVFQEGSNIQLTEAGNVITISAPAAGSGTDDQNLSVQAGTGSTSVIDVEDGDSVIISAGTGLSISESGNTITLTNTVTDTDTDQQDLSVGAGTAATSIIDINNGDSVVLREGSNIQLTESGSQITISATGDGTGTDDQNLTLGAGTGTTSILDMESGSDVTIQAGSNITLSESGSTLTIAATGDGTGTDDQNISLALALDDEFTWLSYVFNVLLFSLTVATINLAVRHVETIKSKGFLSLWTKYVWSIWLKTIPLVAVVLLTIAFAPWWIQFFMIFIIPFFILIFPSVSTEKFGTGISKGISMGSNSWGLLFVTFILQLILFWIFYQGPVSFLLPFVNEIVSWHTVNVVDNDILVDNIVQAFFKTSLIHIILTFFVSSFAFFYYGLVDQEEAKTLNERFKLFGKRSKVYETPSVD